MRFGHRHRPSTAGSCPLRQTCRARGPAPVRVAWPMAQGKGLRSKDASHASRQADAGTAERQAVPRSNGAAAGVATRVLEPPAGPAGAEHSATDASGGAASHATAPAAGPAAGPAAVPPPSDAAAPSAAEPGSPFGLVRSMPLAGGRLDIVRWRGERMLRIWTPPGYSRSDAAREPYPVVYLNDGQNLYGDTLSLSGHAWHAAEAAAALIGSGELPPFVIVGIDHSGATRSYDYLPYPPGSAGGYRLDADAWPGGGVDAYLAAVRDEILPYAEREYGVSPSPALRGIGGSSFGGICALMAAMRLPGVFGAFLVESPSLWFGDEKLLREELPAFPGPWPARVFLAMGTKEYSGIRQLPEPTFDSRLVDLTHQLAKLLEERGLTPGLRLQVQIEAGATHTESAWAGRLPGALAFLGRHWWRPLLHRRREQLFFTCPRKLHAGQPAVLFFNQARSDVLAHLPTDSLHVSFGFNADWSVGAGNEPLLPAPGPAALRREAALRAAAARAAAAVAAAKAPPALPPAPEASAPPAPAPEAQPSPPSIVGDPEGEGDAGVSGGPAWRMATFTVPPEAYEMHLAFSGGQAGQEVLWDNNAGNNFYLRVKMGMTEAQRSHSVEQALQEGPAWGDVQAIAHKRGGSLYFTTPEVLLAGSPAVLYVNRRRTRGLEHSPNLRALCGFNGWSCGSQELFLKPANLWRGDDIDWWSATFTVPPDATDMAFVLTDGHGVWDNNAGHNYLLQVKQPNLTAAGGGAPKAAPRGVQSVESMPHAAGTLHIVTLAKREGGSGAECRASRWTEEQRLRVWTPPGFDAAKPPPGGYPVLYMQDGQNMFEDWLAHQGVSWRVGYAASDLISAGELPPFLVVAVDSAGPMRSLNYLPYPPGTGTGGFRGDAERWPGGGLEAYMGRLVGELMPLVQQRFAASSDPARVAFGGGSFAGVAALYAALHYPHVFGCVLAESPSLWIAEGRFLEDMRCHRGMLPERLFLGCGTREYSATRDHEREDVDALLLGYCRQAASILEGQGMRGGRLRFLVEEGAGHHELAWQWRLTGAMRFLFSPWWDA